MHAVYQPNFHVECTACMAHHGHMAFTKDKGALNGMYLSQA